MPGRNQQGDYRYAYQGQEKDPETGWEAFELRMYDGRVGRWMTTDPRDFGTSLTRSIIRLIWRWGIIR
jgi:RHS repeat-associated protein